MDGTRKKLPYEIVEIILSHLPAKSLLRFKSVCKSWAAIISDQRFAGLHLRQSRKSSGNQDIFFWREYQGWKYDCHYLKILKEPESLHKRSRLDHLDPVVLCYCDGLALRRYSKLYHNQFVLCNLSTGSSAEFSCPYEIYYHSHATIYGLCYNPLINDYEVLIIDQNYYAVYYCRSMCWSGMKETPQDFRGLLLGRGVSLNGDLYFIIKTDEDWGYKIQIVGFDPCEEKFKKFPQPIYAQKDSVFMYMTCFEGHLCLCFNNRHYQMIKVGGKYNDDDDQELSWMDFDGKLPFSQDDLPYTTDHEDETVLYWNENTTRIGYHRIPYLDNLFISSPKQVIRKRRSTPIDNLHSSNVLS